MAARLGRKKCRIDASQSRWSSSVCPPPSPFSDEFDGFGSIDAIVDPPDAETYLYSFETLRASDKQGNALPRRLIPVPFNIEDRKIDDRFIGREACAPVQTRTFLPGHTPSSALSRSPPREPAPETSTSAGLPPGSYMLLCSPADARPRAFLSISIGGARSICAIEMPRSEAIPAGFFYIAGGDAIVGGESANSVAPHVQPSAPFLMYHDEITMGDYGDFLHDAHEDGSRLLRQNSRIPRDFGKPLAAMSAAGELLPAEPRADPVKFQ